MRYDVRHRPRPRLTSQRPLVIIARTNNLAVGLEMSATAQSLSKDKGSVPLRPSDRTRRTRSISNALKLRLLHGLSAKYATALPSSID
jgi:hypothetical protein